MGEVAQSSRFQPKEYQYSNSYQIYSLKYYETFLANTPIIAHSKNIIFVWVGKPEFGEGRVEK